MPAEPEYRTFQDYIFRYLIREGGRLHLPVHIHTAVGIGDYFNISESNVMNLENILRDPRYADTVFVLIHGGYPLEREAIWLASVKNVYMDSSLMEVVMYPAAFKDSLRSGWKPFPTKSRLAPIHSRTMTLWARKRATGWACRRPARASCRAGGDGRHRRSQRSQGARNGARLPARHGGEPLPRKGPLMPKAKKKATRKSAGRRKRTK